MKTKKKQLSLTFINETKQILNGILSSNVPQTTKHKICGLIEKLNEELKIKSEYKYLYWERYGNLDWAADKHIHFKNMSIGDKISIPKEYVIGVEESDIQGEYSRRYL